MTSSSKFQPIRPTHVAMIMDGNGRWANAHGRPRHAGHRAGVKAARAVIEACEGSEHLHLTAPAGALYAFPGVVGDAAKGFDDHGFALEMLETEDVLVVPGSSFNVPYRHHFRVTLLPQPEDLREVFRRIERLLDRCAERARAQRVAVA